MNDYVFIRKFLGFDWVFTCFQNALGVYNQGFIHGYVYRHTFGYVYNDAFGTTLVTPSVTLGGCRISVDERSPEIIYYSPQLMLPGVNRVPRTRQESYFEAIDHPIELNETEIQLLNGDYIPTEVPNGVLVDVSEGDSEEEREIADLSRLSNLLNQLHSPDSREHDRSDKDYGRTEGVPMYKLI